MDRDAFVEEMMKPHAPLAMDFVVRRPEGADPDRYFSDEAFDAISTQVKTYMMARSVGRAKQTGHPPQALRVKVQLTFDEPEMSDAKLEQENLLPWFAIDDEWLLPVDGEARSA